MSYLLLFYSIASVFLVSVISLIGLVFINFRTNDQRTKSFLVYFISFAAGALFGDAFLHLIPEVIEEAGIGLEVSVYILSGIVFSFIVEKIVHWRHCHYYGIEEGHKHSFAYMNLFGDGVHNFIDGVIIGSSYLVSVPVGIATTVAVALHEIPQEIGDFAILLHGGFTKSKALAYNFVVALMAVAGTILAYFIGSVAESMTVILVGFAAGAFIYIAGSDLIPELHKEVDAKKSFYQLMMFVFGIGIMMLLLLLE